MIVVKSLLGDLEELNGPVIIGWSNDEPIWLTFGAKPKDDDDDDSDDDDSDDDDTDDDDDDSDDDDDKDAKDKKTKRPSPKPKRDPHTKGPNYDVTLKRERIARKKAERQLTALRKQHETDAEKLQREAEEAAAKKYRPVAISSAATAALASAGAKPGNVKRLTRLIDMDELDIDDDNEVVGLGEQIDLLKDEYPEFFQSDEDDSDDDDDDDDDRRPAKKRPAAKKVPRADGSGRKPVKKTAPKTSAEKLAALANAR